MAWIAGVCVLPRNFVLEDAAGIAILSANVQEQFQSLADDTTQTLNIAGQNSPTNNIDWDGYIITGLGEGTSPFNSVRVNQMQMGTNSYSVTAGTGTEYTATLSPSIIDYAAGFSLWIKIHTDNTGSATLNVNGKGAKTLKKGDGSEDLVAGDLKSGQMVLVAYDGTNMQIMDTVSVDEVETVVEGYVGSQAQLEAETADALLDGENAIYHPATAAVWCNIKGDVASGASVTAITSSGTTCSVNASSHGLIVGDRITISGCNETEYNGSFSVASVVDANNFTYEAASTPSATPATGSPVITELYIRQAHNVTSITDNGTGDYTITFDEDFVSDNSYCLVATAETDLTDFGGGPYVVTGNFVSVDNQPAGSCDIEVLKRGATEGVDNDVSGANYDPAWLNVQIFGQLATV